MFLPRGLLLRSSNRINSVLNTSRQFARKTSKNTQSLVETIDSTSTEDTDNQRRFANSAATQRGLKSNDKPPVSAASQGVLDGIGSEIADHLNDCIAASPGLFKGVSSRDNEHVITIENVILNQDMSHVTALWSSDVLEEFWSKIGLKLGDQQLETFRRKSIKYVNQSLQDKEPKFRTYLMRKLDFRRVPRIFFRCEEKYTSSEKIDLIGEVTEGLRDMERNKLQAEKLFGEESLKDSK